MHNSLRPEHTSEPLAEADTLPLRSRRALGSGLDTAPEALPINLSLQTHSLSLPPSEDTSEWDWRCRDTDPEASTVINTQKQMNSPVRKLLGGEIRSMTQPEPSSNLHPTGHRHMRGRYLH